MQPSKTPILIVEDHLEVALVLRNSLRDLGFGEVVIARDGGGALDQLHKATFGLVMADLGMAPMSGFDLISAIRKDERLCDLPVIAVSGTGDAHAVVAAKSAGATAFILKPYSTATLKSKLAAVLGEIGATEPGR